MKQRNFWVFALFVLLIACEQEPYSSSISSSKISSISSSFSTSSSSVSSDIKTDLFRNGDFRNNLNYYSYYEGSGTIDLAVVNETLEMHIRSGANVWEPRLEQMNIPFVKGKAYRLEYRARTDIPAKKIQVQSGELLNQDPWFTSFGLLTQVDLSPAWKTFSHTFFQGIENTRGGIIFEVGNLYNMEMDYTIYLDDIVIYELANSEIPVSSFEGVDGDPIIESIPKIELYTTNGQPITSNIDYVTGSFTLKDEKSPFLNVSNLPMSIRGRGNSTWFMPKKPYKMKFDQKVNLFGLGAAKDWVLLANYVDKSLLRNYITYQFAKEKTSLEFSVGSVMVEVYLNHDYQGMYLLTEQVETGTNRINIEYPYQEQDEVVPFLVEWDRRILETGAPNDSYFMLNGTPFAYQYPSSDDPLFTRLQKDYIQRYITNAHNAMMSRTNYGNYIDVLSFVDYFLVQELFKNVDAGFSSVFLYKPIDEKMKMGPIWDFDLAIGNAEYIDYSPYNWWSNSPNGNYWFYSLMQDPAFYTVFKNRYLALQDEIQEMIDSIPIIGRDIAEQASENFEVWRILGLYDWPNPPEVIQADTFEKQVYYVQNFIKTRNKWIVDQLK